MACMEHICTKCRNQFMDNQIHKQCPYCKSPEVTHWFDETEEHEEMIIDEED